MRTSNIPTLKAKKVISSVETKVKKFNRSQTIPTFTAEEEEDKVSPLNIRILPIKRIRLN